MRHLASVILGPILGFAAYILFGFGAGRLSAEDGWSSDNVVGVLAILAAGAAYAVLVVPRLSPLGPALAGIAYLGIGLWIVTDVSSFVDVVPIDLAGLDNAGIGPGVLSIALAMPLLATLISPNRWMTSTRPAAQPIVAGSPPGPAQFGGQPEPPPFGGGQPEPPPFGGQPNYGAPPIGTPYGGPPTYGPPPGSPVAPPASSGYDPYGTPPPSSGPPDTFRPDVTRRIQ